MVETFKMYAKLGKQNWRLIGDSSKKITGPTCTADGSNCIISYEVQHLRPHKTTSVPTPLKHGEYETLY